MIPRNNLIKNYRFDTLKQEKTPNNFSFSYGNHCYPPAELIICVKIAIYRMSIFNNTFHHFGITSLRKISKKWSKFRDLVIILSILLSLSD